MTFNDLRYIVVIAEENSITKAADKLYMTQPALSQYLKKVEKELGVLIFERTTTGVRPTAEGVQFLAFAKNVLHQEQDMRKQLQNLRGGDVGEVREMPYRPPLWQRCGWALPASRPPMCCPTSFRIST